MIYKQIKWVCQYWAWFGFYIVLCVLWCFFSSPEPKAQVSFSDKSFSVVRRRCCCRHCCHKLFTFSSSSPEPLDQFQPNLAQNILGWGGYKFVQIKASALFQGEIITKYRIYIDENKKIFFSRTTGPISTKLGTKHPWVTWIQVCSNEGLCLFPRGDN